MANVLESLARNRKLAARSTRMITSRNQRHHGLRGIPCPRLDSYYAECVRCGPEYRVREGVRLEPDARITGLKVRIKTANSWTGRDLKEVGLFLGSGPGDHYNVYTHG